MSQPQQGLSPLTTFLDLLYGWDKENSQLYKSVTWVYRAEDGGKRFANYAAQDRDGLERLISNRIARNTDVYVALGGLRNAIDKFSTDGFPKVKRKAENVVSLKSIWLDVDTGKGYDGTYDAIKAFHKALTLVGLPMPTMMVYSGSGGFHVYWCTDTPMTKDEWHVLAWSLRNAFVFHQLKFDGSVTIDAARVLRVPGSMNYKKDPPTNVRMAMKPPHHVYSYQQLHDVLGKYYHLVPPPAEKKPAVILSEKAKNFSDNVVSIAPTPSIDTVAEVCPTVRDVLARGGDGDPEPLWNQMMYLAAFTDDPETTAHRLSNQDPRYTEAETIIKLEQKVIAKTSGQLGWPSCASIASTCSTCDGCPLLQHGKGPLYFAMKKMKVVPAVQQMQTTGLAGAPSSAPVSSVIGIFPGGNTGGGGGGTGSGPTMPPPQMPQDDPIMPPGYWRSPDNIVMTTFYDKKGQPYVDSFFRYPIEDVWIDTQTGELVFLTSIGDRQAYVAVNATATSSKANLANALGTGRVVVDNQSETMRFFVAWIKHIQGLRRKGITASALGWQQGNKSFTYGGFTHAETGASVAYVKNIDDRFMPKGDLKHWTDAAELIYGNPALEVLVASAFAAPLVGILGNTSCVLAAHSYESGHGKTTALQIAQAVWGHPITGMSALSDTANAIMEKVSTLQSLPSYWDELKTEADNAAVIDLIFQVTGGKSKARLRQDGTPMVVKPFATMFITASNKRVQNIALKQTKNTNAGGIRVFEAEVPEMAVTESQLAASKKLHWLNENYGKAGEEYARWITANRKTVDGIVTAVDKDLAPLDFSQAERFWATTMTTLITSALITNAMKLTRFNVPAMKKYLIECLDKMRGTLNNGHLSSTNKSNATEILNVMINDIDTTNLLVTDTVSPIRAGRRATAPNKMLRGPIRQIGAVWMQRGETDGRIRAHRWSFDKWLEEKNLDPDKLIRDLRAFYNITIDKVTIGARVQGWTGSSQQQWCYDMTPIPGAFPNEEEDDPTSSPSPYSTPGGP